MCEGGDCVSHEELGSNGNIHCIGLEEVFKTHHTYVIMHVEAGCQD